MYISNNNRLSVGLEYNGDGALTNQRGNGLFVEASYCHHQVFLGLVSSIISGVPVLKLAVECIQILF
jgi:hypothetical protein